jgi:hypothetical protein
MARLMVHMFVRFSHADLEEAAKGAADVREVEVRAEVARWLTGRADGYRKDADHREKAKPGDKGPIPWGPLSIDARHAVAHELDDAAREVNNG